MDGRIYQALGLVFRYLENNDLDNAFNVCRTWMDIAVYEDISRECFTYIIDDLKKNYQLHCLFNNKLQLSQCNFVPRLQIFFTKNEKSEYVDGYLCKTMKFNSYTVIMKSNQDEETFEKDNSLASFSFLLESSAEVKIYTYILPIIRKNMFGSKLQLIYGSDIKPSKRLTNESEILFGAENFNSNIMFILCKESGHYHLVSCFNNLIDGFSYSNTIAWGGTVNELSVCRFSIRKHFCRIESEFVFIFMSNPRMRAFVENLPADGQGIISIFPRLLRFKRRVQLSFDSIAFLHASTSYVAHYVAAVIKVFKEIFPRVTLFRFYGTNSFGGYGLEETYTNMLRSEKMNIGLAASIMILTFL
ncbi:hypothetical protein M0804_009775 [Polistes exclamans]|nr:hypothetical protein M0804_009775 [Polistes exclamans]